MKLRILTLALILAGSSAGQRPKPSMDGPTPEARQLRDIDRAPDDAKKLALYEQFVSQNPKHEAVGWVYEQMQPAYLKAGQPDKTLEIGAKMLTMNPDDAEAAHQNLLAAEAKNDPDLIRKWSDQTSQLARKVAQSPQPSKPEEVENWKARVDWATQLDTYTEYSLFSAALKSQDPKKRIELADALNARNPKSQYIPMLAETRFGSYRQSGDNQKALEFAEKTLETDQSSEDMLIYVAYEYVQKKRNPDKVIAYSAKIVELMDTKPKPAAVSDEDWNKKKRTMSGLAHYMSGTTLFTQNKFADADKELRAALPLVEGNDQIKAEALFDLGLANYKMKNIPDALKFNQQCAAIKSPYQSKAAENVRAMKGQPAKK